MVARSGRRNVGDDRHYFLVGPLLARNGRQLCRCSALFLFTFPRHKKVLKAALQKRAAEVTYGILSLA